MDDRDPRLTKVTAILWILVGVTLVLLFAARVAQYQNDRDYSYVVPKPKPVLPVRH